MAKTKNKNKQSSLQFNKRLILNQYILSLFEVDSFDSLAGELKDIDGGLDENNISSYCHHLINRTVEREQLSKDLLLKYDEHIVKHTLTISEKRDRLIEWKYFQYLSLLFTEIYLDLYFNDTALLLKRLNDYTTKFNEDLKKADQVEQYSYDDLNKLAFWNATGSGKTLLMHVNILQYKFYLDFHQQSDELNRIILLTPNEGLSRQHLDEFQLSNIEAELFDKSMGGLYRASGVEIIDIHKLKDEGKEKTVSVEAFEGNNLVLVDEGHRGSSGTEWKTMRDRLSEQGFSMEYSATFGQAIQSSTNKQLVQEYAKCILFDYSYRYFYSDGYGKDYKILNLKNDDDDEIKRKYFIANLLSFYQQLRLYQDRKLQLSRFLLEKPLWIFVGGRVNAVRQEKKKSVSDVVDIIISLNDFIKDDQKSISVIQQLLQGKSGLLDDREQDIFQDSFSYLIELGYSSTELFHDILQTVFHTTSEGANIHIDNLKGIDGELGLRVGDNNYFGVINVGDESKLIKLCEENGLLTSERDFIESLFNTINDSKSTVNVLIGSKKFTEGWSSWRVSCMGLMNIGKNEGSEIIQLFGRGVRLKGLDFCLKRTSALPLTDREKPNHIEILETLNIFGVRADYMQKFKEYLEDEDVPTDDDFIEINLPVKKNAVKDPLRVIKLRDDKNYKKQGPKPILNEPPAMMKQNPVVLNWYPKIQALQSLKRQTPVDVTQLHSAKLTPRHVAFMDIDEIYFELQQFKNERSWYNLNITRSNVEKLLNQTDWYQLYIPEEDMKFDSFENIKRWQEIAVTLLKKYCEQFYHFHKSLWENQYLSYYDVSDDDLTNGLKIKDEKRVYRFSVHEGNESVINKLSRLKQEIDSGKYGDINVDDYGHGGLHFIDFDHHAYEPLVYIEKGTTSIKVSPTALNEGEKLFIKDLKNYLKQYSERFDHKKVYLLRNQSRKGLGFFEAGNFYPDFILWILNDDEQYIAFVDPKGIRNIEAGIHNPKIQFHKTIKDIEQRMSEQDNDIHLTSFIVSNTKYDELSSWGQKFSKEELEEHHILFQQDDPYTYIGKLIDKILD